MASTEGTDEASSSKEHQTDSRPVSSQLPMMEHLTELRNRIIISLVSVIVAFFITFYFREIIFKIVLGPYGPDFKPVVLDVTERFFNYFKVSMAAGLILASPVIIGQLIGFVLPALHPHEKRVFLPVIPFVALLFSAGVAFGYFLVLPVALNFLLGFGSDVIANQIRLDRSVNFVVNLCLACGIVFQLPVVVFMLSKVGLINAAFMVKNRKMAIVIITILAAFLTPTPDPFTMLLVASPMYVLYEISVHVARFSAPKKKLDE